MFLEEIICANVGCDALMRATRHFKKLGEEVRQQQEVPLWCAPLLHPSWYITNDSGIPERCAQTSHMFPFGIAAVFTFHPIFHLQHTSAPSCTHAVWLCTFHLLPPTGVLYLIMCHMPSAVRILHFFTQPKSQQWLWIGTTLTMQLMQQTKRRISSKKNVKWKDIGSNDRKSYPCELKVGGCSAVLMKGIWYSEVGSIAA